MIGKRVRYKQSFSRSRAFRAQSLPERVGERVSSRKGDNRRKSAPERSPTKRQVSAHTPEWCNDTRRWSRGPCGEPCGEAFSQLASFLVPFNNSLLNLK